MSKELTDNEIETIVEAAESSVPEGGIDMRDIQESVQVDEDAELVAGEVYIDNDTKNITPEFVTGMTTEPVNNLIAEDVGDDFNIVTGVDKPSNNISLFDIGNTDTEETINTDVIGDTVKGAFDLSDEDVFKVIETISQMRKDPNYPVYANLPVSMQNTIAKAAYDNKIPVSNLNAMARVLMEEFAKEAAIDSSLIDLEKALDEALKIPSILDLYSEHTSEVMNKIIPETVEKIKDEYPEKAELLLKVRDAFNDSYSLALARKSYDDEARIRKAIRRYKTEYNKSIDKFNFNNDKSNFKMNDAHGMYDVLVKILITDPDLVGGTYQENGEEDKIPEDCMKLLNLDITETDIKKFCILVCKHCENMDPYDVVDASYMYYLVRNIVALKHTREAKTEFAVELINNICDTITFIRDKESEFNESNMDKSKRSKKSTSDKRNSK